MFNEGGLAERQGFEPWEGYPSTVFKTAAFDRSAISPCEILSQHNVVCKWFFCFSHRFINETMTKALF